MPVSVHTHNLFLEMGEEQGFFAHMNSAMHSYLLIPQLCVYTEDAPDTDLAGYPAGRISGYSKSRIPDNYPVWPDTVYPAGYLAYK